MDKEKLDKANFLAEQIRRYESRIADFSKVDDFDVRIERKKALVTYALFCDNEDEREISKEIKTQIISFLEKRKAELEQEFKEL